MAKGKGNSIRREFIPSTDAKKTHEIDVLSPVDKGLDFMPDSDTKQIGYKK